MDLVLVFKKNANNVSTGPGELDSIWFIVL